MLSLAATALIALGLYALWQRVGRPSGIEEVERLAEAEELRKPLLYPLGYELAGSRAYSR